MQTKKTLFSVLTVMIFTMTPMLRINASAQDIWQKERETAKSIVACDSLHSGIAFLSDPICEGRAPGTDGSLEAADWICRQFEYAGLQQFGSSWKKSFHIGHNLKGRNVIGFLAGSKSIPCNRYIIVGAHYDHLGTIDGKLYPGADANASGVVTMTSLAKMYGAMRKMGKILESNIIFVAFDSREPEHKGSKSLWNLIDYEKLIDPVTGQTITKDKITLMVNIDQIGCTLSPVREDRPDYLIMLGTNSLKSTQRNHLRNANIETGIGLDLCLDYYGSANFTKVFYRLSDQRIFVDNKIPAVLFTSGITMNNNKTWDTVDTIDLPVLQKRIYLIFHWLEKML